MDRQIDNLTLAEIMAPAMDREIESGKTVTSGGLAFAAIAALRTAGFVILDGAELAEFQNRFIRLTQERDDLRKKVESRTSC